MGRAGATRKPNVLKKKEGTYHATRDDGLDLPASYPDPPLILEKRARKYWDEIRGVLESSGVAAVPDGFGLALLANALADYAEAAATVRKEGTYATSEKGNPYQHPCVGQMHKSADRVRRLLLEFGMTPAARSGLKLTNVADSDPLALLMGGRMN